MDRVVYFARSRRLLASFKVNRGKEEVANQSGAQPTLMYSAPTSSTVPIRVTITPYTTKHILRCKDDYRKRLLLSTMRSQFSDCRNDDDGDISNFVSVLYIPYKSSIIRREACADLIHRRLHVVVGCKWNELSRMRCACFFVSATHDASVAQRVRSRATDNNWRLQSRQRVWEAAGAAEMFQ